MKVIAFLGSPRKNGNTEILLKETIRGIEEAGLSVQIFDLNSLKLSPCQNCGGCDETGECIFHDDMDEIYDAIRTSNRIILASPIFFSGLSAQTKIMIDRCQSFWCEKYLLKRPIPEGGFKRKGLLLLVGGRREGTGVRCAEASATAFFRSISVPEHTTLSYLGIDKKGEILKHGTALKEVYNAGRSLVGS
ncbi:MAG: flavodoxin family protein [Nitrospirae bacterium]|nr:flavodoxin family protein [Nitrospirota bacterium]